MSLCAHCSPQYRTCQGEQALPFSPILSHGPSRIYRTHRRHQQPPCSLRQASPPVPKLQHARTRPSAIASFHTWRDPTLAEMQPQGTASQSASHAALPGSAAAAEGIVCFVSCTRLPSLTAFCSSLLSSLPLIPAAPSAQSSAWHEQARAENRHEQQQQQQTHGDEKGGVRGGPLSLPPDFPDSVHKCMLWIEHLHEWYSMWQAMATSTESLLYLIPPSAAKAKASSTRLLVQLNQLERQLSGSSAVHHALDQCITLLQEVDSVLNSNPSSSSTNSTSSGKVGKLGSEPVSTSNISNISGGHWRAEREPGDAGLQEQHQHGHFHESTTDQQQGQQQPHRLPHVSLTEALRQAHAVKKCMMQGSYQLRHEQAFSVVLTVQEKLEMLEGYRDHERALLAQAQRLLHSAEATPEAEVSAQELREDAVLAQMVRGSTDEDEGGSLPLTLVACALLLHHHPDSSVRQQVYELGVEGRCLRALQLMDQLADVRLKIARCCGYPSYSHLSRSGPTSGSCCTPTASRLLTQLIEALGPAAQQQVQQHGHAAVAAASAETASGDDGGGFASAGGAGAGSLDDVQVESALLQALAPHGLDYAPSPTSISGSQPLQISQQQKREPVNGEPLPASGSEQHLTDSGDEQQSVFNPPVEATAPDQAIAPDAATASGEATALRPVPPGLPPLPSLLAGISEFLRTTLGVWFELHDALPADNLKDGMEENGQAGTVRLGSGDFGGNVHLGNDGSRNISDGDGSNCIDSITHHQLLHQFLRQLQLSALSDQRSRVDQPQDVQYSTQQQQHRQRQQQQQQDLVVASVHHEQHGCVGTLVVHPTAACGTRYLCMEGSPRHKQGARSDHFEEQTELHFNESQHREAQYTPGPDESQEGGQPMVLIGLHGFKGRSKAEGLLSPHRSRVLELQHSAPLSPEQEGEQQQVWQQQEGGQQQSLGHKYGQQQQQQQQQIQQDVLLSESALCLWELLHELGHALHMLLSWTPVQGYLCRAGSNGAVIESSSVSGGNSGSHASSTILPAALVDSPLQLPLELLELPSTLLELTAAQPKCVTTILSAAHWHHQQVDLTSHMTTNKKAVHTSSSSSRSRSTGVSHNASMQTQGRDGVHTAAFTPQQLGNALAGEVRRQLYRPLQLQVQAMTALLDQLLLCRNHSSPTTSGAPQEAIALWVGLCEGALPMGMDALFTCQQAQGSYRVMELRGQYAGYQMAWLLATSAWHHHGLDKDPSSPNAWRSLGRLVFESLQQESRAVSAGGPGFAKGCRELQGNEQPGVLDDGDQQVWPGFTGDLKILLGGKQAGIQANGDEQERRDLAWLRALVGPDQVQQLNGDQRQRGSGSPELKDKELTSREPGLLEHLIVDAEAFAVCL